MATLSDPRGASNDQYAWSVAVARTTAGTYVVIGGNNTNGQRDNVYVYTGSGTTWPLQATIADPGHTYQDMFGEALAISGATLVVGASGFNNHSGAAYIYQRSGPSWDKKAQLRDPVGSPGDNFGESVAVSGNTALVGAINATYVYTHETGIGWVQTFTISNPGAMNNNFGKSVALSGTTAIIGAPGSPPGPPPNAPGTVYVYTSSGTAWNEQQALIPPSGGGSYTYGLSVAMTGSAIVVGMPLYGAVRIDCGAAFIYVMSGSQWVEQGMQTDPVCSAPDMFGSSVGLSGTYGAYGAPDTNNNSGAAYVFSLP